jgi:hypothetical protein
VDAGATVGGSAELEGVAVVGMAAAGAPMVPTGAALAAGAGNGLAPEGTEAPENPVVGVDAMVPGAI